MVQSLMTRSIPKIIDRLEKIKDNDSKINFLIYVYLKARSEYRRNAIWALIESYTKEKINE